MGGRLNAPVKKPEDRIRNFEEYVGGYSLQSAVTEASRCLLCYDAPCVKGCPAGVDIPVFVKRIKTQDFLGAIDAIRAANPLPGVCARICPTKQLCEKNCCTEMLSAAINVGALQRFASDFEKTRGVQTKKLSSTGKKVAVVGSGPAGLAAATKLSELGYKVTVFEEGSVPGGLLNWGIPTYRLPQNIVATEIDYLKKQGLKILIKKKVENVNVLFKDGFEAVFLGIGATDCVYLGIPGEEFEGFFLGLDFLKRAKRERMDFVLGKKVAVIGGGNVAMDVARCLVRFGARMVQIIYRRSPKEMPAYKLEIEAAREEGVELIFLTAPSRILSDESGKVVGLECHKMELTEPDESGRRKAISIPHLKLKLDVDLIIGAIGQKVEKRFIKNNPDILMHNGFIAINEETRMTSKPGVFAGGDAVNGGMTAVQAAAEGKLAAYGIDKYLRGY